MTEVDMPELPSELSVPWRQDIANLFPQAPVEADQIILPHGPRETILLRRLGIQAPSPVLSNYKWSGMRVPFEVQKTTVEMLTMNARAYVLSSMGVGKTACPIWAFDYLKAQGLATRMLVVAPLSTLNFVWAREVFIVAPHLKTIVLHGSKEKRLKLLKEPADIYVINHDGIGVVLEELAQRTDIDVMVIDELAVYRNKSGRTKKMKALASKKIWVWGMTGAPTPNAPTDVYHQASIVTPESVPKFYGRFREELMVHIPDTFKWIPKIDATDKAFRVLQPSVRFTLEDVTELPPFISRRVDVDMGPNQKRVYDEMRKHCFSMIAGKTITAANAGAALNKLLQISLGYVYHKDKGVVSLDNDERIAALLDIVNSGEGKMLVFAPFKHALRGVFEHVTNDGWECAMVSGDTSMGKRSEIFHEFQNTDRYKAIIAHPQCLAHGVTLTTADTVVWFGPITSLEIYDQANARIRRVGQTKKQLFLHLQSTPTEKKLYTLLINKQAVQSELLSMFEA